MHIACCIEELYPLVKGVKSIVWRGTEKFSDMLPHACSSKLHACRGSIPSEAIIR